MAIADSLGIPKEKKLARFATRYRFAGQLKSIELLGSSSTANELYTLVLRISLAYSALESLDKHLGDRKSVKSENVASMLRSKNLSKFMDFIIGESDKSLSNRLKTFYDSKKSSDVRPIIEALRHSMFHGQFNPTASRLSTKSGREMLGELDLAIFKHMDKLASPEFARLIAEMQFEENRNISFLC